MLIASSFAPVMVLPEIVYVTFPDADDALRPARMSMLSHDADGLVWVLDSVLFEIVNVGVPPVAASCAFAVWPPRKVLLPVTVTVDVPALETISKPALPFVC